MAALRPIPLLCEQFLTKEEAPIDRVYDDKQPRKILVPGDKVLGKLTAGIGHTGPDLIIGMPVTANMIQAWLEKDLEHARTELYARIGESIVSLLTEEQYSALLSFIFNLGAEPKWTIWKVLKAKQFDSVPSELVKFVYWNGKKSPGLVNRRNAEVVLWSTNEPGTHSSADAPPSSVTRDDPTPPAPSGTPPLHAQPGFIASATTAIVAGGSAAYPAVQQASTGVKQIADALSPYADKSSHIGSIYTMLITVLAGLAAASVVLLWFKHRYDTQAPQSPTAR